MKAYTINQMANWFNKYGIGRHEGKLKINYTHRNCKAMNDANKALDKKAGRAPKNNVYLFYGIEKETK